MSGKGDTPRPLSVDPETYAERYARTFNTPESLLRKYPPLPGGLSQYNTTHLSTPPHDWPQRDTLPTTDPED